MGLNGLNLIYDSFRAISGPPVYDHDDIMLHCNKNACNVPENIAVLKGIFNKTEFTNFGLSTQQCTTGCEFSVPFNEPLKWANNCKLIEQSECVVTLLINYDRRSIGVSFGHLSDIGVPIPSEITAGVYRTWSYQVRSDLRRKQHNIMYMCRTRENECDKKYVEANIKKIQDSIIDEAIYDRFSKLLHSSSSSVQKCYTNQGSLQNCEGGLCQYDIVSFSQVLNQTCQRGDPSTLRIEYTSLRAVSGPSTHDQENIRLICNKDACNSRENVAKVKRILNGIESANSGTTKNLYLSFILSTLCFAIIYFQ